MRVQAHGTTDVGLKRGHNEDSFLIVEDQNLYMVADGMGGHSAGEVASKLAVETIANFYRESERDDDITWPFRMDKGQSYESNRMANAIKLANLRIYEAARMNEEQHGMGTTVVSVHASHNGVTIGHVGDSRVYAVHDEHLEPLTEDHSLLNDYIRMKELTEEEIENFPHKNVIVRALGMREGVQVDIINRPFVPGRTYLLCSDGLCGMVSDPSIARIINSHGDDLEAASGSLIDAANDAGGTDNITALLLRVEK
jgi:protein phosphatase